MQKSWNLENPLALYVIVFDEFSSNIVSGKLNLGGEGKWIHELWRKDLVHSNDGWNIKLVWRLVVQVNIAHPLLDVDHVIQVHIQKAHRRPECNLA